MRNRPSVSFGTNFPCNCKKKYLKMDEWKDIFINEWLKEWIKIICMTEWKDEAMKEGINKWLNGRIDGRINEYWIN